MTTRGKWPTRAGWLVAFFAPPVAAATAWQSTVAHHPALTVIFGAAYEFAVAAIGFATGIATDLASRWEKRIADSIDATLQRGISRFDKRYREFVLSGLRFIDLKGLATIGPFTPELSDVYVDVSLAYRSPHMLRADMLWELPTDVTERHLLEKLINHEKPVVLAVIGAPGSGKTTLLRHTARRIFLNRVRQNPGRHVPILLYLRDHAAAITSKKRFDLPDMARITLGRLATNEPRGWFHQQLRAGNCIVLLDGLDEVARPEDRSSVVTWVENQIRYYPDNDYVITSRPHGYPTGGIHGAAILQVRNFTDEQVRSFVNGWYLAVERHSTGSDDQDVGRRAELAAKDLLERLDRAPALHDLTVNPLLLTMIANVHRYRGALPGSRADLYAEICQVMLFRRQEAKNLAVRWPGDKKEALLRRLAYVMMQRKLSDLPQDDIHSEFKPALDRLPFQITAEDFLDEVVVSGLLVEREAGIYSFAHHTFQEYLAAAHIRDRNLAHVLTQTVDDPWWRETTLLYAARADADLIIAACLDSANITALALAFDCADQGSEFAAGLRDRLDKLLDTASDPETSLERRKLVIGALLARHLTQQIKVDDGNRICIHPITSRLYRFFMYDTGRPSPDGMREDTKGIDPASGMHVNDAISFVQWVNTTIGGPVIYRLPDSSALTSPAIQRLLISASDNIGRSVWTKPCHPTPRNGEENSPELWIPPGVQHPHLIDAPILDEHITDDINDALPTVVRLIVLHSAFAIRVLSHAFIIERARSKSDSHRICRTFDSALDRALRSALYPEFTTTLDRSLALDEACARVASHPLPSDQIANNGLDLTRALGRAEAHGLRHAFETAINSTMPHAADGKFGLNLIQVIGRILDFNHGLVVDERANSLDLKRARLIANTIDQAFEDSFTIEFHHIVGRALAHAIAEILQKNREPGKWPSKFSNALGRAAGITGNYIVLPDIDIITEKLGTARQAFNEFITNQENALQSSWAFRASERVGQVSPSVGRTYEATIPLRLPILCLAAEADALDQAHLGDKFREVAAGATLLERRLAKSAPTTEIILLSAD